MRISIFTLTLFLTLALTLSSCTVRSPQFRGISDFKVNRDNPDKKVQFQVGVDFFNPNGFKLKLLRYDLDIYLNNRKVGEAHDRRNMVLKRKAQGTLKFGFRTTLKQVLAGIAGVFGGVATGKRGIDLRISGVVRAKARGIAKNVPIDFTKNVPWAMPGLR